MSPMTAPWFSIIARALLFAAVPAAAQGVNDNPDALSQACPDYLDYSQVPHPPYSGGPLNLPFQRPVPECRKFVSSVVDKVVDEVSERIEDKDLAQLFRNALPNTLDTTIAWHVNGTSNNKGGDSGAWQGAQTFVVTGDITAEWLRDSTNQLAPYQSLARKDKKLYRLILGAINTQAEYVIQFPYCNAFQPPPPSGLDPSSNGQDDVVTPPYDPNLVFECKYELDSLAAFLALGNRFHEETGSTEFVTDRWYKALHTLLRVLDEQARPTFNRQGQFVENEYTFRRRTDRGTETLNLDGIGNPLNGGTGLIRSAFRPSDDASIFGFFIPPNAMMSVQLGKTAKLLTKAGNRKLASELERRANALRRAVFEHGVVHHPRYGRVFAFEVDGYGSALFMDDANIPSLLSLPYIGFIDAHDPIYRNTRKMITERAGNPYYLSGSDFHGIGGPHVGLRNAWPMSLLVQAITSFDDREIMTCLELVRNSSLLGLVHESIDVNNIEDYTRPWFAWANSLFGETILKIARERPSLIFGKGAKPYET